MGKPLVIATLGVLMALASAWLLWLYGWQTVEIAFADEQTAIFEEMRSEAVRGDPARAAGCLEYVVFYYPSGTKQRVGSRLDRVVERSRARAVAEIVAHLRRSTAEDLGEAAEPWIARYAR